MGCGPGHLLSQGLDEHLASLGVEVQTERVDAEGHFQAENQTTFELARRTARRVAQAGAEGIFPIVLAGNCDMALGTVAGLTPGRVGIIWFDAHSDFRTPQRSYDGFLDGMGLAMIAGLCWPWAVSTVPGFRPLPPERILHVGGRLLDEERRFFNEAGVDFLPAAEMLERGVERSLSRCLDRFCRHVDRIDLHLDLDVVDPSFGAANSYARENGLEPWQVQRAFELICDRLEIGAMDLTGYEPACDPESKLVPVAFELLSHVVSRRGLR
jgi:arginase